MPPILIDLIFVLGAFLTCPIWGFKLIRTGKFRTDWAGRFGRVSPTARSGNAETSLTAGTENRKQPARPRLLFHAVSVGEVNAVRLLVAELHHDFEIIIASTTNTGYARAVTLYAETCRVVRYPLDFSFAVNRFLDSLAPEMVALVELEVWPNFMTACRQRGIPVVVVNGRLSARSFARYRKIRWLIAGMFHQLELVAAQDDADADRFRELGTDSERVRTVGTMKWDNATITAAQLVEGAKELAESFGIDEQAPIVVAGSTAETEEALIHHAVGPGVQLIVAPRKPERFAEAAAVLPGCVRRTACREKANPKGSTNRFLLDTIGELKMAYALADVVIVGRSFGNLHGSDMIEPIALGKATIVGPRTGDFAAIMKALLKENGIRQLKSSRELAAGITELLNSEKDRKELARRGQAVIKAQQGAVARHAELLRTVMARRTTTEG